MTPRSPCHELRWWVLRAHWALGILLLAAYTETPARLLLPTAGAWTAGVWMDRAGMERTTLARVGSPIVGLFLALAAGDLLFAGRDLLASMSILLLGVQAVRLLLPKRARDGWQLSAISLLEFLAAAVSTEKLSFAIFTFLFLSASAGAMWSLQDQEAEENGRPARGYETPLRTAALTLVLAGVLGFLITALLFAAVPRLEFRRGVGRISRGDAVSGFADTIVLREVTGIKSDRRVVARVEFPFLARGLSPTALYLRGAVYSRYDDGWQRLRGRVSVVPRAGFEHLLGNAAPGPLSVADITLEAADHPRLLTYGHPSTIEGIAGPLLEDTEGSLLLPQPDHPTMRYRLRFATDLPRRTGAAFRPGAEYLAFPEGYEDVRALGRKIMGTEGTDAERAAHLLRFFREGFRYTVTDPAPSLRRFLFAEKAGYCEHYAAALALLLRAGGIPSRVVVGYLGGEWNGYGRYLIVRQSDAHAWVEAWIAGRWETLDATPPQGEASPFFRKTGFLGLHLDWLRQRWDKYVVNYSMRTQAAAVSAGWSALRGPRGLPPGRRSRWLFPAAAIAVLVAAAILSLVRSRRRRGEKTGGSTGTASRLPAPYARLLRRLDLAGWRSSPGVPLEDVVGAAVRARPELAEDAALFLTLYHRDRFGPVPPDPSTRPEAFRAADRLRRRLSS